MNAARWIAAGGFYFPFQILTILSRRGRQGLVRIGLPAEGEDTVLDELARRISGRVLQASRPAVTQTRGQLDEYFEQHRTALDAGRA